MVVALKATPKALTWKPDGASLIQRVMLKGTKARVSLPFTVCDMHRGWRELPSFLVELGHQVTQGTRQHRNSIASQAGVKCL